MLSKEFLNYLNSKRKSRLSIEAINIAKIIIYNKNSMSFEELRILNREDRYYKDTLVKSLEELKRRGFLIEKNNKYSIKEGV